MNIAPDRIDFEDWLSARTEELAQLSSAAGVTKVQLREAMRLRDKLVASLGAPVERGARPALLIVAGSDHA